MNNYYETIDEIPIEAEIGENKGEFYIHISAFDKYNHMSHLKIILTPEQVKQLEKFRKDLNYE